MHLRLTDFTRAWVEIRNKNDNRPNPNKADGWIRAQHSTIAEQDVWFEVIDPASSTL